MVVPMPVAVAVLVELGFIAKRVTAVIYDHRHGKLMRLRNLLDRFPIGSTVREPEVLAFITRPTRLNRNGVGRNAGQPKTRRDTRLKDR